MSKYIKLWEYVEHTGESCPALSFDEIRRIAGVPIDHSFLHYKKELADYGYEVRKISIKNQMVAFAKTET